jgi:glycosyltransferase involved in cell wall biosynthesis
MKAEPGVRRCLTYISVPHLGGGFVQTCMDILENFPSSVLMPTIVLPKRFQSISPTVAVKQAVPSPIPFRFASPVVRPILDYRFRRALDADDPRNTVVYFWPNPPTSLVRHARKRGFLTVREMINTYTGSAKVILDDAYRRAGLSPTHKITEEFAENERKELALYDYIFSPNPMVEKSLLETGIDASKILHSTYGWTPGRYASSVAESDRKGFRALFVGTICVRKGVLQLLEAWKKSGVVGELLLAGRIEESIKPLLSSYLENHGVRLAGYVSDVGRLYKSADVFVFPTLEEGDPQVTYEAAGCGLPAITTLMGRANIINNGINGLLVAPYDIDGLATAIARLASDSELRARLAKQAAKDAQDYTYEKIGPERARILSALLAQCSAFSQTHRHST